MGSFNGALDKFYDRIEIYCSQKFYVYYLALFLCLLSIFLVTPCFSCYYPDSLHWLGIIKKSVNLTSNLPEFAPGTHMAKMTFRLTVPIIIRIFSLSPLQIIILQYIITYFSLIIIFKISKRILNDAVTATLITGAFIFIYFGRAGFSDISEIWFDGFAFFFLLLCIFSRKNLLIFLFATAAAWTDERGFIALSIAVLFHQISNSEKENKYDFINLIQLNGKAIAVVLAMIFYLASRAILSITLDMDTPTQGASLQVLGRTVRYLPLGLWTFLEGFWILILALIMSAAAEKKYMFLLSIFLAFGVLTLVSFMVTDITRSGSYLAPMVFVALFYLKDKINTSNFRLLLAICLGVCFLSPGLMLCPDWPMENMLKPPRALIYIGNLFSQF